MSTSKLVSDVLRSVLTFAITQGRVAAPHDGLNADRAMIAKWELDDPVRPSGRRRLC